jgi:hypothetical protein
MVPVVEHAVREAPQAGEKKRCDDERHNCTENVTMKILKTIGGGWLFVAAVVVMLMGYAIPARADAPLDLFLDLVVWVCTNWSCVP